MLLLPHSVEEQQAAERILSKQPNKAANFVIERASAAADVARLLQLASAMHPQYMLIVQVLSSSLRCANLIVVGHSVVTLSALSHLRLRRM